MRLGFAVFAAALTLAWCSLLQPVAACVYGIPPPFAVDPSLVGVDTSSPAPFRDVVARTHQISGTRCEGKTCTSSSCGDDGLIELTFSPPEDDRSDVAQLGYRVLWRGALPEGVTSLSDGIQPLSDAHSLTLRLGFDAVARLDGELSLVAVDRAGNESTPSAPVHVGWSGCLSYFDAPDRCVQHNEACAVAAPGAGHELPVLPLMAALALCSRWLRVGRRRRR